jgi:hypothetical protein
MMRKREAKYLYSKNWITNAFASPHHRIYVRVGSAGGSGSSTSTTTNSIKSLDDASNQEHKSGKKKKKSKKVCSHFTFFQSNSSLSLKKKKCLILCETNRFCSVTRHVGPKRGRHSSSTSTPHKYTQPL